MNQVWMMGNVSIEPEKKEGDGYKLVNFSIATNRDYAKEEKTDFHRVVAWNSLADLSSKFVKKGDRVAIIGSLINSTFVNKEGKKVERSEIRAQQISFLGKRKKDSKGNEVEVIAETVG